MSKNTFTLISESVGGQATLHEAAQSAGGENHSPHLQWINAPATTQSFAVTIYDQTAPTGGGFWHWIVFNLPNTTTMLPVDAGDILKNLMPEGTVQARNDYGTYGYGGPHPPKGHGDHLYLVTVHALDTISLLIDKDTPANQIGFNIWSHTIDKASLVFYYTIK